MTAGQASHKRSYDRLYVKREAQRADCRREVHCLWFPRKEGQEGRHLCAEMPLLCVESPQADQCLSEEAEAVLGEARGMCGMREERGDARTEAVRMARREK